MEKNKKRKDITNHVGAHAGDYIANNAQHGTKATIDGMDLFRTKAVKMTRPGHEVGYEQGKGNLFEFIESAKLSRNVANSGKSDFDKVTVTDVPKSQGGFGEHTAPDDFRLMRDGKIIGRGQAKINNNSHDTAVNFTDNKYSGMQRVTASDRVTEVKEQLQSMRNKGEISTDTYNDAIANLQENGLQDTQTGISSGGTTTNELLEFKGDDGKISRQAVMEYSKRFERQQYIHEIGVRTVGGAATGAISTGIVSSVTNFFEVYKNEKELKEALKDIGVDTVKGSVRGGTTGFLSSLLRIGGTKAKVPIISDASAATAIAGGVIDSGVSIYAYCKGEINSSELKDEMAGTLIKSTTTIYFTKAIGAVIGAANPFIPMAVYSVASYVVACTQAVIKNAKLNAEEYRRIEQINHEATELVREYRKKMKVFLDTYELNQRLALNKFLDTFELNLNIDKNYDKAIYSIVNLATEVGITLQHIEFNDFKQAMISEETFILK